MLESLPILCCVLAFICCTYMVMQDFICKASGPLEKECKKLAKISYPMASLSMVAAIATLLLVGTTGGLGGSSIRRR